MKAMIFAAGLGTRLKPLTDTMPKALVPIAGKPLLEHVIEKLKKADFNEIIINLHHFPEQIIEFLLSKNNFGIRIETSIEEELLDTGGGIRKASWFFDDGAPFLVHNVDILSNFDLKALYKQHLQSDPLASLLVSRRETQRYLLFDQKLILKGWTNIQTNEIKPAGLSEISSFEKLAFSGIQVLSARTLDLIEKEKKKFPIMDFYLSQLHNHNIKALVPTNAKLFDVGKIDTLDLAEKFIAEI